jgi:hypothetical protein
MLVGRFPHHASDSAAARRQHQPERLHLNVPAIRLGDPVPVRERHVLQADAAARVAPAAVQVHGHRRRRRAADAHVLHLADLDARALGKKLVSI